MGKKNGKSAVAKAATRVPASELELMHARGYLHAVEVARRLNVRVNMVYTWLARGKIEGEVVCHRRRYVLVSSLVAHVGPSVAQAAGLA
jgi:predicted Rossmann fold nucleotide-binding protein DprA/Smf involved in DNA uptake